MQSKLLNIPASSNDWSEFSYHNRTSHAAIRSALAARGAAMVDYQLDPISPSDVGGWLERHAQTHIEMNGALGVQSDNLQDVDLKDKSQLASWINLHWQEHVTAESRLGV